ncbi:BRD4-interacting chromatin-remodeling complex-associated protein isoform X1 [Strix aluco]|uniref:BRD4-interacting chromatin-remodeling complex-associated protein isoform X1 n=1 Tax=Strix aluco TaxID=111821 RepID=UPI003DA32392
MCRCLAGSWLRSPCGDVWETPRRLLLKHHVDMDDEDGRCLLDVICDPQALNDFLHGSEKIDSDDLLDNTGDAASAFFEGAGLHVQEASGNHLSTEPSQPTTSVDLDFLEDDILGSPASAGANLPNSEQPCDILQQSLQEANITEQTLEAEAELDLGSFQLPTLQPVVQAGSDGAPQIFSGGADLIGLQQPAVLTHQALVQQSVGAEVVNKTISVQPFLQQVGLGNVTIQPISNLQGLPNGSPGGTLGIGPIQVVGQQVMAINQPAQQIIAKQVQPSGVATMPVGSYITQTAPEQQQVTLASTGVSPQNAGLVIQKNVPTVATTTLNGNSMFGNVSGTQGSQPLTVTSNLSSPLVQAQNVIIHRTPTPIQPKPAGVLQQKLYQITPKPFGPNNTTLTIQNEAALQQQKAQQNLTFMAGKPGQNVVLSGFPQGLPANVFKQPPPQQQALSKPMSVHLLNQSSSIVIPAQHVPQAMLQGQNQFLLPGQLAGASAVQLPQQLSALPANMGGQILTTSHPGGQAHIITSQGPGGQLITNQALPAQILTNQNIAGQLNLGQVLTSQNAHGTAHILSAPIQLQPGQVGQPALFQMPVSLAGSLTTQSQPSVATSLGQTGQTVIQGVTLPNQVAMLNATENLGQAVSIQTSATSQSLGLGQPQPASGASLLPATDQSSILTVQTAAQPPAPLQLNVPPPPPPPPAQQPGTSQPSPSLASSPEKIILGQAAAGPVINQDSMQMFLQQLPAGQQKLPGASPSPSPSLPPPPLGESPQLSAAHLPQIQSPHPSRPPSQPQPLSRPPSRPHSRPPSQPQTLSRPPSEPLSRSCTPQAPVPGLYVIQNQLASSPLGGGQHPLRPPSQPPFQPPPAEPPAPTSLPVPLPTPAEAQHAPSPHFQLQFPPQGQIKPPTPTHTLHLTTEQPRNFPMVPNQFPTLPAAPNPAPQPKQILDRFQQVPQGIILQAKQQPPSSQASPALAQFSGTQGGTGTGTTAAPTHGHAPAALPPASAGITAPVPAESKTLSGVSTPISAGKGAAAPGKSGTPLAIQQPVQTKPGVISSVSGLNLAKGPLQIQVVGKGLSQLVPSVPGQGQQLYDSKLGLKKAPTLQPSKEACFLEQLHKHQGAVLHPDYKTPFRSFDDALQRLLPYHVYQGMLPSEQDCRKVDEEFEVVSTQLLKRTQAMLNKYRLLLLEESRRVSPSAEMVMIDRMFIQEEKTMLALDKQLAKEKPDEYVSSSSRLQGHPPAAAPASSSSSSSSSSGSTPTPENPKLPLAPSAPPLHPTKLVIKHSGGSPSVTWAKASPSLDGDEDALPSRSKPPIKTYEARSRIGLKLKIKQEAGLSKVVHNTALDPVHQPPAAACRVIKGPPDPPPPPPPPPPSAAAGQMNGTVDHVGAAAAAPPAEKKPVVTYCRLPLRKTYRENVDAPAAEKPDGGSNKPDRPPLPAATAKPEDGPRGVITSRKSHDGPSGKNRPEENPKLLFLNRGDARSLVVQPKGDDGAGGLMKELAEVEDEFYRGMIKPEPPDQELTWEVPLPPAKRRKSESFEVDNASFSSDSPQDDSLNEHLQSAIDSILNLQQPQAGAQNVRTPSSSYNSSSSPFSSPVHRTDAYLAPNHNGGLGARTLNR